MNDESELEDPPMVREDPGPGGLLEWIGTDWAGIAYVLSWLLVGVVIGVGLLLGIQALS